jgi:hypothetical protein
MPVLRSYCVATTPFKPWEPHTHTQIGDTKTSIKCFCDGNRKYVNEESNCCYLDQFTFRWLG